MAVGESQIAALVVPRRWKINPDPLPRLSDHEASVLDATFVLVDKNKGLLRRGISNLRIEMPGGSVLRAGIIIHERIHGNAPDPGDFPFISNCRSVRRTFVNLDRTIVRKQNPALDV